MEIELRELVSSKQALDELLAINMKAKLAYRVGRNARKVQQALKPFEDAQNELYKRYGDMQPNGSYMVRPEEIEKFYDEREELLDETVDVDIRPFSFAEFDDNKEIRPRMIAGVWYLFLDEEDAVETEAKESEE
jgi:hypothetical protein